MNKLFIGLILFLLVFGCTDFGGEAIGSVSIEKETMLLGDIDGNGEITCNDALMIFQYVLGKITLTENQIEKADINQDGLITVRDAQLLIIEYNLDCTYLCSLLGDADGNGLLNCDDVECIMNYVLGKTNNKECFYVELCGDVTQNGIITAGDAQQLMIQEELDCSNTCLLLGDVDGDELISCNDVECIYNLALGITSPECINPQCADINDDGIITAGDAQQLMIQEGLNCSNECDLLGDITGDGQITCMDLKCAIEIFSGSTETGECINSFCADINEDGKINSDDIEILTDLIHSSQGTCSTGNCINGVCVTETEPEEPGNENGDDNGGSGSSGTGGGSSGGGGGGLRQCTIEDIVYSEWSACIDGIQSREYTLRTRCAGKYQEFLEELERECEMPPEPEGTAELTGICTPEKEGINCLKDGKIGICKNNECILPETISTQPTEEEPEPIIEKQTELDLTLLIGGILLILILIAAAFYIIQKNKKE
jgi:uncharacterized membrane protein YgcG